MGSATAASVVPRSTTCARRCTEAAGSSRFCFGLIHGFGFASALTDLGLPQGSLLQVLIAFNLGVEPGQLAIVAAFLSIAYALRDTRLYRHAILVGGFLVVAAIATLWLIERALNVALLPGFG